MVLIFNPGTVRPIRHCDAVAAGGIGDQRIDERRCCADCLLCDNVFQIACLGVQFDRATAGAGNDKDAQRTVGEDGEQWP